MALKSGFWSMNQRLQRAAQNNTPMRLFEPDRVAVRLLQQAFVNTRMAHIAVDGIFGANTARAVVSVENQFNMDRDEGVAGRQTLGILDILLQNGQLGHRLALMDVPLARDKVAAARRVLITAPRTAADALRTHFRLGTNHPIVGVTRPATDQDIRSIVALYDQLLALFAASAARFITAVPVNGIDVAAEAPLGGPITFGPAFTNVDSNFDDFDPNLPNRIGQNSRVAIIIHESVHVFDNRSGNANIHIGEWDPAYDRQPADLSLHNPSSYAAFAAHIFQGRDQIPRFGLRYPGRNA